MADTNFTDGVTVVQASWLNDINDTVYSGLGNAGVAPTTPAQVRTNLNVPQRNGTDASGTWGINITGNATSATNISGIVPIVNGGTGQTTASGIESILPIGQSRIDVISASTVNLTSSAPNTDHINITGTTTITGFTVAAGRVYFVRFAGILTLTNNANIIIQGGANIVTRVGDTCVLRATASNVVELMFYTRNITESASLGANGWQRFPSGLILQWGSLSAAPGTNAVSFPLTFPTAVRSVVITSGGPGSGATNTSAAQSLTTSGFSLNNLTGVTNTFYWQAIGE